MIKCVNCKHYFYCPFAVLQDEPEILDDLARILSKKVGENFLPENVETIFLVTKCNNFEPAFKPDEFKPDEFLDHEFELPY